MLRALETGLIDSVQVVYNIFDQNPEDELFPYCREHGIAVIARVPFDEGSLTGTLTPGRDVARGRLAEPLLHARQPRARRSTRVERLMPLVPPGMTLPELALRFILAPPGRHHDDSRHAQAGARRAQPRGQRRPSRCRPARRAAARAPVGAGLAGAVDSRATGQCQGLRARQRAWRRGLAPASPIGPARGRELEP